MFNLKNEIDRLFNFENLTYRMKELYDANDLVVANLEYITNDSYGYTITLKQKYIFEVVDVNGQKKYREVFTGYIFDTSEGEKFFNYPYVSNIIPLKEVIPEITNEIAKLSLLLIVDEVNNKRVDKKK